MKTTYRYLLLVLLLGLGQTVRGQQLRFEKDSLSQVLRRAQQLQKPVFLLLAPPAPPAKLSKEERENRYGSGLSDAAVTQVLERDFLLVQAEFGTPQGQRLARQYGVNTYPTYLYLHPSGTVLHRSFGNTRDPQRYLRDFAAFRAKLTNPDNLAQLEQRYAQGERGGPFLRQYIQARRSVGAPISPALLDAYVAEQPVKAFNQFSEVVFLHECGPVVDSRAYKMARLNKRVVDSMYAVLPLAQRSAFNSLIINNTLQAAIAARNPNLAQQGAAFARGTWVGKDYRQGARTYDQTLLRYYQAVGDTARYLPLLVGFFEQHYMATPADTVRRRQAAQRTLLALQTTRPYPNLARPDSTRHFARVESSGRGAVDTYALELNNGAWAVYTSGTRRTTYLTQALRWSQRTVDLEPRSGYYDTLAHLLYALRFYAEAEVSQQKAIDLAKKEGVAAAGFQDVLRKIKSRTL